MSAQLEGAVLEPLRAPDNASLVVQVRKSVLRAILDGRFKDRLPPEDELGAMLNVSRTTVRAAVQELERDGLVTRRRAIGTLINHHVGVEALALQRLVGFDWLLEAKGHRVEIDVSWKRQIPHELGDLLPEVTELDCCVIQKRYVADGRLAISLVDLVPWSELTTDELPQELPSSLFEFSHRYLGRTITNAVAQIVPMVAKDEKTTSLELKAGTPFIRLVETHYDSAGSAVGWSLVDLHDSVLRLAVFRPR